MKIKVFVATDIYGSTVEDEINVDDNLTDDEIDNEAWEYATNNMIRFGWEKE